MNKKEYNNVIDYTLKHEQSVQGDDSLSTARAIFNNMGVALPQGDMKTVYETIKTDNYMGWKSCTMQEAQAAADNGVAAIGISEDKIVVLSANDEEQPATQTASVMTLDENTSAFAVEGMRYYSYSYGTTTTKSFDSRFLINQGDTTILYPSGERPGTENRAFIDNLFYGSVCGKTSASGNIKQYGCAICSLAMFLLYKGNISNTNNNVYYAVKEATKQGTNSFADLLGGNFSVSYYNGSCCVRVSVGPTDAPDYELNRGNCCIFRINGNPNHHFVLVYGIDTSKSGTDRYLVADPDGGRLINLSEAMRKRGVSASMSNIGNMRVIG